MYQTQDNNSKLKYKYDEYPYLTNKNHNSWKIENPGHHRLISNIVCLSSKNNVALDWSV